MNAAGAANIVGSAAVLWPVAALLAVPGLGDEQRAVVFGKCARRRIQCTTASWHLLGWQLLDEFVHELFAEFELPRTTVTQ